MRTNALAPIHPGKYLREILDELDFPRAELARAIGVSPMRVSHVVNRTRPVTAEVALLLGRAFGQSPQYWLNLQTAYEESAQSGYNGHNLSILRAAMKVMSARDAKNRFGEFLDAARREPVVVTKNERPVAIMISIEDAADTLLPEFLLDRDPGYDGWVFEKVSATLARVDAGEARLRGHDEAMALLRERLRGRVGGRTSKG